MKLFCMLLCIAALYLAGCHKSNSTASPAATHTATQPTQQAHPDSAVVKTYAGVEVTDAWDILPTTDTEGSSRHTDSVIFTVTTLADGRTIIAASPGLRLLSGSYTGINDTFTTNNSQVYAGIDYSFRIQDNMLLASWDTITAVPGHADISYEAWGQYTGYKK